MKTKTILVGFVLAITIAARAVTTNDLATALRNGLLEEQVNHNLDAAIETYQSLVTQFDKDRQLAATAAFRLGECYRTLGKTNEAVAQYQRVVKDFPDQTKLATLSRQNLGALGAMTPTATNPWQEQKTLLEKEISLAEEQSSFAKGRESTGQGTHDQVITKEREVLALRQRLAELTKQGLVDFIDLNPASNSITDEEDQEIRRIQAMIQNSPDLINTQGGEDSSTPLIRAARKDQLQVARFLLEHGADVNRVANNSTPLFAAAFTGHKKMVELLLDNGADVDAKVSNERTALLVAVTREFQAVVEVLLARNADPKVATADKTTALHAAAERSSKKIVELLLARGAEVNAKGREDKTPLHLAAGRPEIVALLLANKADVNARDRSGSTPLHYASGTQAIKLLLANGAEVNARNASGETPLGRSFRSEDSVNALLDANADPNLVTTSGEREGWGPLHYAAENGNAAVAEALLKHGAKPDALTGFRMPNGRYNGSSPLVLAINNQRLDTVKVLLSNKADPNLPNADGQSPLELALTSRADVGIVEALLKSGADVSAPRKIDGATPLQMAVWSGNKVIVETVLAHNPDVNAIGYGGMTALNATHGQKELAEIAALLRAHGALENVPRFDRIQVSRPSANFSMAVFWKGTNEWNRFTLMETILSGYSMQLPASSLSSPGTSDDFASRIRKITDAATSSPLPFPDLNHIVIVRHNRANTNEMRLPVNLLNATNGVDCSRDVVLEFGDVVEIPEREHALSERAIGLTDQQRQGMIICRKGMVQLVVRGQKTEIAFLPDLYSKIGSMLFDNPMARQALLSSSDLTQVKVTRRDPLTGKKLEWILDCHDPRSTPDLWLRDGDVIEVPEK